MTTRASGRRGFLAAVALGVIFVFPSLSEAQIPTEFTNLRVLPEDITPDDLLNVMRGFSLELGVRCQYCHVGGDGISFEGVEFPSDDDPDKRKARFMLRMVNNLNNNVLPLIPERDEPSVEITCKTCHRGAPKPRILAQVLRIALDTEGADSTAALYRRLRETDGMSGRYDFGEWETNILAETLAREDRHRDAIAIYELNAEFYPESFSIFSSLGQLYEQVSDVEAVIRSYERALEIRPGNPGVERRLGELKGG